MFSTGIYHILRLGERALSSLLLASFLFTVLPITPKAIAEEEGGNKAAEVLFGLAAIMAAASPMVAASIQAKADTKIAKINANAQMTMTKMSSDTSKALAEQQKEIALTQAEIAKNISKENQDSTTQRLSMQLAELKVARQDATAADSRKLAYQQELDRERITLAKQQADETVRLANVQVRAQLMQAGMSQGFTRSQDSSSVLTVDRGMGTSAATQSLASTSSVAANSSLASASSVGNQTGSASAFGVAPRLSNPRKSASDEKDAFFKVADKQEEPSAKLRKGKAARALRGLASIRSKPKTAGVK